MFLFDCTETESELLHRLASEEYHIELCSIPVPPRMEELPCLIPMLRGLKAVSVKDTPVSREMLEMMYEAGTRLLCIRSASLDMIDTAAARELDFTVCHTGRGAASEEEALRRTIEACISFYQGRELSPGS